MPPWLAPAPAAAPDRPQIRCAVAEMQASAIFNGGAFTTRPLRRSQRPLVHLCGAGEFSAAGREGWVPTRLRCSASLSLGASGEDVPVFPRNSAWDPYKLLGVDHDASVEEIRSARNFLLQQYSGYEQNEEAIEGAYDKIIMKSYSHSKRSKYSLRSKLKGQVEDSPSWVKTLLGCFDVPSLEIICRRFAFFGFMAGWSIATSAKAGPTFQLALSLISSIYFFNDKMKNITRASTTGLGVFVTGWIIGSLSVPLIPCFIIPPTWSLELLNSLIAYVVLYLGCTFLK